MINYNYHYVCERNIAMTLKKDDRNPIGKCAVRKLKEIRLSLNHYKDKWYADTREFVIPYSSDVEEGEDEHIATKKGISVPIEDLESLRDGLTEMLEIAKKEGLLSDSNT